MNVLITSAGRRAYMVKYFCELVHPEGKVYISNSTPDTVAFQYADKAVISPLIYDKAYIPFLLGYCQENEIDVLISLFDIDLLILARNREAFIEIGTHVIVSDERIIEICNDKWKTYCFLTEHGFNTPKTFLNAKDALYAIKQGTIHYPVIVKPRFGCGSIAVSIAENDEELLYCFRRNKDRISKTYLKYESEREIDNVLVQEMLFGQEYGADVINDLNGNFQNVVLRKKIAMRAGETDIAEIVKDSYAEEALKRLGEITKHVANLDCDLFIINGIPYILEMNARFGGGYPFSHAAGCNLPKAIMNWICGREVPRELLQATIGFKGFKEIVITQG